MIKEIFKIEEFSPHRLEQGGEKLRYVYQFKELRKNSKELGEDWTYLNDNVANDSSTLHLPTIIETH